jgi:hypothetical protein
LGGAIERDVPARPIPRPCSSLSVVSKTAINGIEDENRGVGSESSVETCEYILREPWRGWAKTGEVFAVDVSEKSLPSPLGGVLPLLAIDFSDQLAIEGRQMNE